MFRFRDEGMAQRIMTSLRRYELDLSFMHVCGTHQDTLVKFGLEEMLSQAGIDIRQGPGCPVCVTSTREIADAMALAESGLTLAVFGDMMHVPTPRGSLAEMKAEGHDVRIVYSIEDAIRLAEGGRQVVFMAIGFETTVPTTAVPLMDGVPENFSVYSCHRTIPPALEAIFQMGELRLDGFIQPGHVATIIGTEPFRTFSRRFHIPQVVSGFEPLDLLMSIHMLVSQIRDGRAEVENEYSRLVDDEGNPRAIRSIDEVFRPADVPWRGFPVIPASGLELREEFDQHNAKLTHQDVLDDLPPVEEEKSGCRCGEVLRGLIDSRQCPAFGKGCTPRSPLGPCMVSREGSCNISYRYGKR
ncbi:MAG: hydrogenase formation protein HypD [Methanomassiliicoccales archaeon]